MKNMTNNFKNGFLDKLVEMSGRNVCNDHTLVKRAAPNATETPFDRKPVDESATSVGSDGVVYPGVDYTKQNGVRYLETDFIPSAGEYIQRYELPKDVAEKTRVRAMDTLGGYTRVRKRHVPGHNDSVPSNRVINDDVPEDMKRRMMAWSSLKEQRQDYAGGKNFGMGSFWPEGTNAPMHVLIGDGKIPRTVLQHETGHAIDAGGYESEADYRKKDRLEEEIDAHVNGGSMDSELARGALSTYAIPYYLRDNPDKMKQFVDDTLAEVKPEQRGLGRIALAFGGYDGTNTAAQAAALQRYKSLVFPDKPPESVTYDDIQNLATNGHLRAALDSPDTVSMQDAAQYAQDKTGRSVMPIDISRLDSSLFDPVSLRRRSFDLYSGTPFFGGGPGSVADAAAAENPYLAEIFDYLSKDPSNSGKGYQWSRFPSSGEYLDDLADYMIYKNN